MITLRHAWTRLLLMGLVLALSAAPASAASADKYLPADTDVVVSVNVKPLLESAVIKKYALEEVKSAIQNNAQVGDVLKALNFDPLKDLSTITIGVSASNPRQPDFMVIVHGTFDTTKVHEALAQVAKNQPDTVKITEEGKFKVYEMKGDKQPAYAIFVDKGTMLVASSKTRVVDSANLKGTGKPSKELQAALDKADDKQTIWMAMGVGDAIKAMIKQSPQGGEIAGKLEGLTAGATFKDNVLAEIKIHTTDANVAAQLRDQLDQAKGALTLLALQDPKIGPLVSDIVSGLKVVADGKTVKITSDISAETIDKAVKAAKGSK